jgi:hypothetical protein
MPNHITFHKSNLQFMESSTILEPVTAIFGNANMGQITTKNLVVQSSMHMCRCGESLDGEKGPAVKCCCRWDHMEPASAARPSKGVCLTRCQESPLGVRWQQIAEREALLPPHSCPPLQPVYQGSCPAYSSCVLELGPTPLIARKTGRRPK